MDQVVELQPPQRGRVRKPWTVVAVQDVPGEQSLREAGQEWLKRNGHIHKTLTNSSSSGRVTLIARCNECLECSKQFCFGWTSDNKLQVETTGEHSEKKNEKVMKRHYAKSYGEKNTPCRALKAMRQGGVPTDLRPSTGQLKHARRQLQLDGRVDGYSVECLGEVQEFISNPPADVRVLEEHVICSSERVILPFCLKNMDEVDRIWRETERDLARCVRNLLLCSAPFFRSHTVILMFINAALPDQTYMSPSFLSCVFREGMFI